MALRIADEFDIYVETVLDRYANDEFDEYNAMYLLTEGYENAKSEILSEVSDMVANNEMSLSEAYSISEYVEDNTPEIDYDILEVKTEPLFNYGIPFEERVVYRNTNQVSRMTPQQMERIRKQREKQEKRARLNKTLKKVAIGAGVALGAYGLHKSYTSGYIRDRIDARNDSKAEANLAAKQAHYENLVRGNVRAEHKDYKNLYAQHEEAKKQREQDYKNEMKKAKTTYDKEQIAKKYSKMASDANNDFNKNIEDRVQDSVRYHGPDREQVKTIYKRNGKVDVYATNRAQREANQRYRYQRSQALDAGIQKEQERAQKFREIDDARAYDKYRANRPIGQKVGEAISKGARAVFTAPKRAARKLENDRINRNNNRINKQYSQYYNQVD